MLPITIPVNELMDNGRLSFGSFDCRSLDESECPLSDEADCLPSDVSELVLWDASDCLV